MCSSLMAAGHDVQLCHCATPRYCVETVGDKVRQYQLRASEQFTLDRHIPLGPTFRDLRRLPPYIAAEKFDIVHTHLSHDSAFGGLCCKLLGSRRPPVIRTLHQRSVLPPSLPNRILLRWCADGVLTFTEGFRQATLTRFGLAPERVGVQPMPIDLTRFSPDRTYRDMRPLFGIAPDAPVIGIVGRFQKYRPVRINSRTLVRGGDCFEFPGFACVLAHQHEDGAGFNFPFHGLALP